jgi:hypothetical protein
MATGLLLHTSGGVGRGCCAVAKGASASVVGAGTAQAIAKAEARKGSPMLLWGTLVLQQPREVRQTMMELVAGSQARAISTNRAGSTGDVNPLPCHACT